MFWGSQRKWGRQNKSSGSVGSEERTNRQLAVMGGTGQDGASPSSVAWPVFPGQRTWSATASDSAIIDWRFLKVGRFDRSRYTAKGHERRYGSPQFDLDGSVGMMALHVIEWQPIQAWTQGSSSSIVAARSMALLLRRIAGVSEGSAPTLRRLSCASKIRFP